MQRILSAFLMTIAIFVLVGVLLILATPPDNHSAKAEPVAEPQNTNLFIPSGNATASTSPLDLCGQHANLCPVNSWPGEPDNGWQRTSKKWQWDTNTPSGPTVVWYGSLPYTGTNPTYTNYREAYYDDYSNTPDAYPLVPGNPPTTYEWQAWEPTINNYKLHQYGGPTENLSRFVGETSCYSGIYFPTVDDTLPFVSSSMYVMRQGQCASGGYLGAYLAEQWGERLSPLRISKCDNAVNGVPATQEPQGNLICKLSPHAGVVYQSYVLGPLPGPSGLAVVGCEAVIYTWGWPKPQPVYGGQDYEPWFRNGELRFSRYKTVASLPLSSVPAADDHKWWAAACAPLWSGQTNWLYTGVYKIGLTVYTDTISSIAAANIAAAGGSLVSAYDNTTYLFPANAFTATVTISHSIHVNGNLTSTGTLAGINHFYDVRAVDNSTGLPSELASGQIYTVTIQYTDMDKAGVIENSLKLYFWDKDHWSNQGITDTIDVTKHILTAQTRYFSSFAILGETYKTYLPMILH